MYVVYGCTSFSEILSNSAISIVGSAVGGIGNGFNGARQVDNVSRNRTVFKTIDYNFFFQELKINLFVTRIAKIIILKRIKLHAKVVWLLYIDIAYSNYFSSDFLFFKAQNLQIFF